MPPTERRRNGDFYEEESRFVACSNALPEMEKLVTEYAGKKLPIAKTTQVGHLPDSHGLVIGSRLVLGG